MLKTKNPYYYEQPIIQNNLANEIHQIQKKMDYMIQSHQKLIELIQKCLPYRQQTQHYTIRAQIMTPSKPQQVHNNNQLINSDFQNSSMSFYNQVQSTLDKQVYNAKQSSEESEQQEFFQRFGEYQEIEHSTICDPSFKEDQFNNSDLFEIKEQKDSKIKLAHPQKILESLESQFRIMSLNFYSCQCLYVYPQMNNESFYQKITDCNNILFLAMLENNEVIGAFTEIGFSSKLNLIPKDNPKCCLFNLNQNHLLYAQRTNKTHSCDKSYILFGNWQFKIKVGDNVMSSDLGRRGDCFKKERYGVNQKEVNNTREWIFGQLKQQESYVLQKYMICALK